MVSKDYIIYHKEDPESTLSYISRWICETKIQVTIICVLSLTVIGDCHGHEHQSCFKGINGSLSHVGYQYSHYPFYVTTAGTI